jgi:hypothetical protein
VVYLVDTIEVDPGKVEEYLRTVEEFGIPVMTGAGAHFVSCRTTSKELGEPVSIEVVWAFEDHERWNDIRKNLVLDARWYAFGDRIAELRTGGTRRFYYPVSFDASTL